MTWVAYRGVELSARLQQALLGLELAILERVRRRRARPGLRRAHQRGVDASVALLAEPVRALARRADRRGAARRLRVLGLGCVRDRQRGVRGLRHRSGTSRRRCPRSSCSSSSRWSPRPARRRPVRAFLSAHSTDVLDALGVRVFGSAVRQAAGARRPHLDGRLDADDDHADRAHPAVDGSLGRAAHGPRPHSPAVRHAVDRDASDGRNIGGVDGGAAARRSRAERARRLDHRDLGS